MQINKKKYPQCKASTQTQAHAKEVFKNKINFKFSLLILYVVLNIEVQKLSIYFTQGDIPQNEITYIQSGNKIIILIKIVTNFICIFI